MAADREKPEIELTPEEPRRHRALPPWLAWGCAGGCLVVLIAAGALLWWWKGVFEEATDPEVQWPRLAQVLPFDERPAGLELHQGWQFGWQSFLLSERDGDLQLVVMEAPSAEDLEPFFQEEPADLPPNAPEPIDAETGVAELQGREVRTLAYRIEPEDEGEGWAGGSLRLDASDGGHHLMLEVRRPGGPPPAPEEAAEILAPFDVWRGR